VDVGYSTKLAFYGCLLQPHDQAEVTRTINTTRELYNQQRKD